MAKETTKLTEQELQEQVAELREDLKKITSLIGTIGSDRLNNAKNKAESFYGNAKTHGEELIKDAKQKLYTAEKNVINCVREKPVESLAVAAVAGIVLALILRR